MRLITRKQRKAIYKLLDFVNQNKNEFGFDDYDWQRKLRHITHMVYNGSLNHLASTGKDTQSIFKFLISSTKMMNKTISDYNAEMFCMYHDNPNMINHRIIDEASTFY